MFFFSVHTFFMEKSSQRPQPLGGTLQLWTETTTRWSVTDCGVDPSLLSRLMQKQMYVARAHVHLVMVWRSRVVKDRSTGSEAEGRIRRSGSCYGAATAGSGCCCSLWGWEPACLLPTACPNTGCCSRAARWAAKEKENKWEKIM